MITNLSEIIQSLSVIDEPESSDVIVGYNNRNRTYHFVFQIDMLRH